VRSPSEMTERHLEGRVKALLDRDAGEETGLRDLIKRINAEVGPAILFGGMLRDLARGGARAFSSDVDIVVDTDDSDRLHQFVHNLNAHRTRTAFGGYRIAFGKRDVDLWTLRDTWACRSGHIRGTSPSSLVATTFFDWDAIAYDTSTREFHMLPDYFERLASGVLDVNLEANPNPVGIVVRSLRWVRHAQVTLSPRLTHYIGDVFRKTPAPEISAIVRTWDKAADLDRKLIMRYAELVDGHVAAHPGSPFPRRHVQLSLASTGQGVPVTTDDWSKAGLNCWAGTVCPSARSPSPEAPKAPLALLGATCQAQWSRRGPRDE
jgi:hypothetical protein